MSQQVVTANTLAVGDVVYLASSGGWTGWIDEARVSASESDAEEMLALGKKAVGACLVVDPYLIDVTVDGGKIKPVRWREVIRSAGPPVQPHLGKQATRR